MVDKFKIYSENLKRYVTYNFLENKDSDIYIYFFDGQNLFDIEDSYMDATFEMKEALVKSGIAANVVGIFANDDRTNEYTPYIGLDDTAIDYFDMDFEYKPNGIATGKFIVDELIPHVEKDNPSQIRIIGGASLGGLMSLYMGQAYPETFTRILAMSSHFNLNIEETARFLSNYNDKSQKVYMDVGTNEYEDNKILSQTYIDLNKMAAGFLRDMVDVKFMIFEGGIHHEKDWAERMPEALEYLLK